MDAPQPAKRGDLIVIEYHNAGTRSNFSTTVDTGYRLGRVTGTRDGWVTSADVVTIGGLSRTKLDGKYGQGRTWVQPATTVDVDKAIAIAKAHHWPGHPNQPRDFDSLAAVRTALAPAKR